MGDGGWGWGSSQQAPRCAYIRLSRKQGPLSLRESSSSATGVSPTVGRLGGEKVWFPRRLGLWEALETTWAWKWLKVSLLPQEFPQGLFRNQQALHGGPSHHALHIGRGPQWPFLDPRGCGGTGSLMKAAMTVLGPESWGPAGPAPMTEGGAGWVVDGWPRPEAGGGH